MKAFKVLLRHGQIQRNVCTGSRLRATQQLRFLSTDKSTPKSKRGAFFANLKKQDKEESDKSHTGDNTGTKPLKKNLEILTLSNVHTFENENEFEQVLHLTISNVHKAVEDLRDQNPDLVIEKESKSLRIHVNDTVFTVTGADYKLMFLSPESGARVYVMSGAKKWVDEQDGHGFSGLFIRDFMRHAYGIPVIE